MLARLARWGKAAEDTVLVLLLSAMIALATSQIVMRNLFDSGLIWADEALRLMVLWLALAGAVAAARADKHISIDVLSRFLPPIGFRLARTVTHLFTAGVCGAIAWHAWRFVASSREYEDTLLGDQPAWIFQVVLPVAFALMAWRYLCLALTAFVALFAKRRGDAAS
ncbi:MAG: TRAP transporter small permease subunit [Pseudomonadota bacterium]